MSRSDVRGALYLALSAMLIAGASLAWAAARRTSQSTLSLSATALAFSNTAVGQTSATQTVTLTDSGKSSLGLKVIALSDTTNFALTSTCGKTLTASAHCTLSITFKPQTAATLNATLTINSSTPAAKKTVALSGTGTRASAFAHTLYIEPDAGFNWIYALVSNAQKTIDLTMYELVDTTFSADLVAACNHGVKARVILDQNHEKASNTTAYNQLNATANCSAVWANTAFQATHQKTMVIDSTTAVIMSFNLTSRYYATSRDFGLVESDTADIAAIQATFAADYAAGTSSSGTPGASDFGYQPGSGDDLIWSPTTAQPDLLAIINNAQKTLLVENEEMGVSSIVTALENACKRGVAVQIAMTDTSAAYHANYTALESAGCGVHIGANDNTTLYIHAKAIVADFGLPTLKVYMGSINFSDPSMTENRELGLYISDPAIVQQLRTAMTSDYTQFPAF